MCTQNIENVWMRPNASFTGSSAQLRPSSAPTWRSSCGWNATRTRSTAQLHYPSAFGISTCSPMKNEPNELIPACVRISQTCSSPYRVEQAPLTVQIMSIIMHCIKLFFVFYCYWETFIYEIRRDGIYWHNTNVIKSAGKRYEGRVDTFLSQRKNKSQNNIRLCTGCKRFVSSRNFWRYQNACCREKPLPVNRLSDSDIEGANWITGYQNYPMI